MAKQILITFAKEPTYEYPLAVVLIDPEGYWPTGRGQDHLVRNMKDARLFANGMCCGGHRANPSDRDWPVNPTIDPRLLQEEIV